MPAQYRMEMAAWATDLLKSRSLTLRQAEIATGVTYTTISNIMAGRVPEATIMIRFASGFKQDIPKALRLAGYEDIAAMWESGEYPRPAPEALEESDALEAGEEVARRREIGRRIRLRMDALGMKQYELGKLIGKTQGTLNGYLTGRVGLDAVDLARIAKALRIPVAKLYGEDEDLDADADGDRPRLVAFYDDLTPEGKEDLLALAETVWRRKRREDSVFGRKAE